MSTDNQLMAKLVAGFNEVYQEMESRKRVLDSNIDECNRKKKGAEDRLAQAISAEEKYEKESNYWQDVYSKTREDYAYNKWENARAGLQIARDTKRTNEEELNRVKYRPSELEEERDALQKKLDNLSLQSMDKKAEAYYNWLLEDFNAAKSENEYAALAKKFRDISGYKDCADLEKKCYECIKEQHYRNLVANMGTAIYAKEFATLEIEFTNMGGYKDCEALAKKCAEISKEKEKEERKKAEEEGVIKRLDKELEAKLKPLDDAIAELEKKAKKDEDAYWWVILAAPIVGIILALIIIGGIGYAILGGIVGFIFWFIFCMIWDSNVKKELERKTAEINSHKDALRAEYYKKMEEIRKKYS